MRKFLREIAKLYNEKHDFTGNAVKDLTSPFAFFGREFARMNNIDGHEVMSVIVNDYRNIEFSDGTHNAGNKYEGVQLSNVILYCRKSDISGFKRSLTLRLNGHTYTVQEFHEIQGLLWRVVLEENE